MQENLERSGAHLTIFCLDRGIGERRFQNPLNSLPKSRLASFDHRDEIDYFSPEPRVWWTVHRQELRCQHLSPTFNNEHNRKVISIQLLCTSLETRTLTKRDDIHFQRRAPFLCIFCSTWQVAEPAEKHLQLYLEAWRHYLPKKTTRLCAARRKKIQLFFRPRYAWSRHGQGLRQATRPYCFPSWGEWTGGGKVVRFCGWILFLVASFCP